MGVNVEKIIFENNSRNTYENILYSKEIIKPKKNEKWLIITSASHMKRALLVGQKLDWHFIPYAVDFKNGKNFYFKPSFKLISNLNYFHKATHEWLGIISYYLMKRTEKIF